MAKVIKYVIREYINNGSEKPGIEEKLSPMTIVCKTQAAYDINYLIAEKEAIPGTIEVSGEFDPESDTASINDIINTLLGV